MPAILARGARGLNSMCSAKRCQGQRKHIIASSSFIRHNNMRHRRGRADFISKLVHLEILNCFRSLSNL